MKANKKMSHRKKSRLTKSNSKLSGKKFLPSIKKYATNVTKKSSLLSLQVIPFNLTNVLPNLPSTQS
jgi:hypothetical protein